MLYTYHQDNLRFFPRIARGTEAWKTTYAKHTSVERSNKRKKVDYKLEATLSEPLPEGYCFIDPWTCEWFHISDFSRTCGPFPGPM